jgi:hypothetical protein
MRVKDALAQVIQQIQGEFDAMVLQKCLVYLAYHDAIPEEIAKCKLMTIRIYLRQWEQEGVLVKIDEVKAGDPNDGLTTYCLMPMFTEDIDEDPDARPLFQWMENTSRRGHLDWRWLITHPAVEARSL